MPIHFRPGPWARIMTKTVDRKPLTDGTFTLQPHMKRGGDKGGFVVGDLWSDGTGPLGKHRLQRLSAFVKYHSRLITKFPFDINIKVMVRSLTLPRQPKCPTTGHLLNLVL